MSILIIILALIILLMFLLPAAMILILAHLLKIRAREGKAHATDRPLPTTTATPAADRPLPTTTAGSNIPNDSDYQEPTVIQGLLESIMLRSHRESYRENQGLRSLMDVGIRDVFLGLIHMLMAKKKVNAIPSDLDTPEDFMRFSSDLNKSKEQNLELEQKLIKSEADTRRIAEDKQQLIESLQSQLQEAASRSSKADRELVLYKIKSEQDILDLRQSLERTQGELQGRHSAYASLSAENDELNQYLLNTTDELQESLDAYIVLSAKCQELQKTEQKATADLQGIQKAFNSLTTENEELCQSEQDVIAGHISLGAQNDGLISIISVLRSRYKERVDELTWLTTKNTDLMRDLIKFCNAEAKCSLLEGEITALNQQLTVYSDVLTKILQE